MKRLFCASIIIVFLTINCCRTVFANSDYVLPYPSAMPGGYLYKINLVNEFLQKYWSFGSLSQFHNNLHYADKYLVETKTLFEYDQYLLAVNALKRSNEYFLAAIASLHNAEREKKDTTLKKKTLDSASLKHKEVLELLVKEVPAEFVWAAEKKTPITLLLHIEIKEAIKIRNVQ